jgi:hypothetical protein
VKRLHPLISDIFRDYMYKPAKEFAFCYSQGIAKGEDDRTRRTYRVKEGVGKILNVD